MHLKETHQYKDTKIAPIIRIYEEVDKNKPKNLKEGDAISFASSNQKQPEIVEYSPKIDG